EGRQGNSKRNKRQIFFRTINIVIVVCFGAFLVYYLLKQVNIADIRQAFLGMYKPTLIAALAIMLLSNLFRAYRKKILVGSDRIGMGDMFLVAMIRNAFNMVLPARTGELSYVYVLTRRFMFPLEIGVSTLMVVLMFDLVIVFSLILISIIIVGINAYAISSVSVIAVAVVLLAISLLILFYLSNIIDLALIMYRKLLMRFKVAEEKLIFKIYKKLLDINVNLRLIKAKKIYWKVYLSSIATRVLKFTSYYLIIHAILSPMGYTFSDLNYWVILLATIAAEISAVLPTHALAGFGTYEGAFALAFIMLGFTQEISIIVGFSYHLVVLLFTVILGIIAMIIISMPFYRIKKERLKNAQDDPL
ncbi:MAG: flippase-like domain-containing protein, partial [Actinobacteria bacterium]|nr:flippase-like domain-containing protein [Actinomycetota bacterium]